MKKHNIYNGIALIVLLAMLLVFVTGVYAQEEPTTETFDEVALPGWERSEKAVVQDGVLRIAPGNFAVKFGDYGEGTFSVKVKQHTPGVVFLRYFMREEGSYAVIIFPENIILEKTLADQPQEMGLRVVWSY